MVILVDDEDRENEGDFAMAAEDITPEAVNFMALEGRGLICVPMTQEDLERLRLPMMVSRNTSAHGTAFTVSIDDADPLGPFATGTVAEPNTSQLAASGRLIRFDVETSTGGNVGAVELRVLAP